MSDHTSEPLTAGGDLAPSSTGTLNLRPEVLEGFLSVRQQHEQLQALLHQVMRRVALPRAKAIGDELQRLKGFYASGKSGPMGHSSRFYADAKAITGLSKPTVANYVQLAQGFHRLIDYMADLPEGATPITSMKGALEALRAMNRPLRPADDSITVDALPVAGDALAAAGGGRRRTSYAASTREKVLPALTTLRATSVLTDRQREQLEKIEEALALLLDSIEQQEAQAAAADEPAADEQVVEVPTLAPVDEQVVAATDEPPAPVSEPQWAEQQSERARSPLADRFPKTAAGLADLRDAITSAGSGAALGRELGCTPQAVSFWLKAVKAAVEGAG